MKTSFTKYFCFTLSIFAQSCNYCSNVSCSSSSSKEVCAIHLIALKCPTGWTVWNNTVNSDITNATIYSWQVTLICLFIVIQNSIMKYITRIGQKTGTLKASKNVHAIATRIPLVAECLKNNINN